MSESTPDAAGPRAGWRRRRVVAAAAVAVVVVAGAVTGALIVSSSSSSDDHDASPTRVGAQFIAPVDTSATGGAVVRLPGGSLTVFVDRSPRDKPTDARGAPVPAPDGGRLVLVGWAGSRQPGTRVFAAKPVSRPLTITLVTGARRYPLNVDARATASRYTRDDVPSGAAWVAVRGTAASSRVEVGYDGVLQRVDPVSKRIDKGRAELLYAMSPANEVECTPRFSGSQRLDERDRPDCTVTTRRTAYVEGLSWAPAGRAWLVMSPELGLPFQVLSGKASYFADRPGTVAYRYAGKAVIPAGVDGPPGPDFGTFADLGPSDTVVASVPAVPASAQPFVVSVATMATRDRPDGSVVDIVAVTVTFTAMVA